MTDNTENQENGPFNFEASLEELESLVSAMEEGDLSLEESLKAFESGVRLTRECQTALQQAEQKVQVLMDDEGAPQALNDEASQKTQ